MGPSESPDFFSFVTKTTMADALISSMIVKKLTARERFEEDDFYGDATASPSPSPFPTVFGFSTRAPAAKVAGAGFDAFSFVVSALISAIAIYLSWTCNSALGYGTLEKVLYAFGAGFFGVIYLFFYVLFRGDTCKMASK